MKNLKKLFSLLIIVSLTIVLGIQNVFAADVPSSINVSSIGKINYGGTYYFPVKYTSDGTLAYCTEFSDLYPMGITMSNPKRLEAGISYIIANGYKGTKADYGNDSKMKQYYITQLAIYTYLGQANPSNNNDVHKAVWDLVNKAKSAKSNDVTLNVSLTAASEKMTLTSDGKYFISDAITVKSNVSSQSFSIAASQNVGAFVVDANGKTVTSVKSGDKVYAKVPSSVITDGQTLTLSVSVKGSRTKQAAYLYQPSESKYQNITPGVTYPKTESASATVKVKATKDKKTPTKVKISKRDITTKEELPGAKLVIKDASGNVKASWTSTNEPKYIEGLAAGKYTLCETQAPDGYVLETECINFTVKSDGTIASVIMYNEKKPTVTKVQISKQDITTKKELPGAKLVIKDANGNVKASWTSTSEPKYIEGLAAGTYYLTETAAPEGYELYTESIKFTVYANGSVSKVIMYNSPKVVTKVKISKQDITTKKELPGASLTIKDANGKVVESWVSTSTPKYIEGLAAGNYTLCETAAPQGYELYTECIKFVIKADGTLSTVVMYNTPKKEEEPKTKLSIIKKDADTKEALEGATFELKDKDGKLVETWVSTKDAKVFNNLQEGTYTLTETKAPKGYVLNKEPMTFELKANNKTTTVIMYNKKEEEKPTKVKISKQDITTKKELPGATLVIKDASGKEIEKWVSTNEPKYIENLAVGDYTLCETQAPDGYVLATECIKFTVKNDGSIASVIMYNTKKPVEEEPKPEPKPTKVQISKQDITTKKELPGATLVIKDANGKEIEKWVSTNEPKYIEGLAEGKYTLCETQAPDGYVLATECVSFTVKADGNITKVVMYNTKKPVEEDPKVYKTKISKQDITTKEELPGATLVIKNAEGVELHRFVSSNTPTYFELQPGTYTLTEIQAPNGYILSTEVITFTVSEDHTVVTEVVMYNTPAVEVPITASNISMIVYIIGLLGIAFGFKTVFVNARI